MNFHGNRLGFWFLNAQKVDQLTEIIIYGDNSGSMDTFNDTLSIAWQVGTIKNLLRPFYPSDSEYFKRVTFTVDPRERVLNLVQQETGGFKNLDSTKKIGLYFTDESSPYNADGVEDSRTPGMELWRTMYKQPFPADINIDIAAVMSKYKLVTQRKKWVHGLMPVSGAQGKVDKLFEAVVNGDQSLSTLYAPGKVNWSLYDYKDVIAVNYLVPYNATQTQVAGVIKNMIIQLGFNL